MTTEEKACCGTKAEESAKSCCGGKGEGAGKSCCGPKVKKGCCRRTFMLILGVFIATVLGLATLQPDRFFVSRTAVIAAPATQVFPQVNNLHNWEQWSPWAQLDPESTAEYSGPAEGVDAAMAWNGNMSVGKGKMTIVESVENEKVVLRLDFEKPMAGTSVAEFTFTPEVAGTKVTWSMTGENSFVSKVMGLFMNCTDMVGGYFDQGLANLKALVEK